VDTPGKKVTGLTIQPSGRIIGFMEDTLVRIGINKATGKTEIYKIDASTDQQDIVYVQPPEIWTANADGSNKKMLIKNGSDPLPSSDGQYLIYRNLQTGHSVVIEIEKNKEIWLGALSFDASWHPDSRRIIYSEVRIEEQAKGGYGIESVTGEIMDADLYIMDVLSGDSKPLTNTKDEVELYPNCSPDGSKIVYVSGITGDIYLMDMSPKNWTHPLINF